MASNTYWELLYEPSTVLASGDQEVEDLAPAKVTFTLQSGFSSARAESETAIGWP